MKTSKHTTGQWYTASKGIIETDSRYICQMTGVTTGKDENKITPEDLANAKRIVKAVNMYDELIDLARNYLIRLETLQLQKPTQAKEDEIKIAKKLIKQAEQK